MKPRVIQLFSLAIIPARMLKLLRDRVTILQDRLKVYEQIYAEHYYYIENRPKCYIVWQRLITGTPPKYTSKMQEWAIVKIFPKNNDPEYAKLCAQELLDKLNETM